METILWRVASSLAEEKETFDNLVCYTREVIFNQVLPRLPTCILNDVDKDQMLKLAVLLEQGSKNVEDGRNVLFAALAIDSKEESNAVGNDHGLFAKPGLKKMSFTEKLLRIGVSPDGSLHDELFELQPGPMSANLIITAAEARSPKALERLLAVRPILPQDSKLFESISELYPACGVVLKAYIKNGPTPLPKLAKEGKHWAIFNLLRRKKVRPEELVEKFEGKNALEYAGLNDDLDLIRELEYHTKTLLERRFTPRMGWISLERVHGGNQAVEGQSRDYPSLGGEGALLPPGGLRDQRENSSRITDAAERYVGLARSMSDAAGTQTAGSHPKGPIFEPERGVNFGAGGKGPAPPGHPHQQLSLLGPTSKPVDASQQQRKPHGIPGFPPAGPADFVREQGTASSQFHGTGARPKCRKPLLPLPPAVHSAPPRFPFPVPFSQTSQLFPKPTMTANNRFQRGLLPDPGTVHQNGAFYGSGASGHVDFGAHGSAVKRPRQGETFKRQ